MQSVLGQTLYEFTEKKSRFIGLIFHVRSSQEVEEILIKVKKDYPGANHYVYAYIIDQTIQKASDDGEPQRTAGYPVLEVLNKNGLNDCLAIVIRYFGGIKLGAGGLIRAYSHSIAEAIKKATFIKKVTQYSCSLTIPYVSLNDIERYLRDHAHIDHIDYSDKVNIHFKVYNHNVDQVRKHLSNLTDYEDKVKVIEEKIVYAKVND